MIEPFSIWTVSGFVLALFLSAFFSGSETGLTAVNRIRLRHLAEEGNPNARRVIRMLDNPDRVLSAMLVGTNLSNVAATSFATLMFVSLLGSYGASVATVVVTIIILVFGEILPKTLFRMRASLMVRSLSRVLRLFIYLFWPVIIVTSSISKAITWMLGVKRTGKSVFLTKEELRLLVVEGEKEGVLEAHEKDMIHSIFQFSETKVRKVMIPISKVKSVSMKAKRQDVLKMAAKSGFTRYPVWNRNPRNIIGFLNIFDMLYSKDESDWRNLIRPLVTVSEGKSIGALIQELQSQGDSMAVVKAKRTSMGIITMEDMMEEIVGEIYDPRDAEAK